MIPEPPLPPRPDTFGPPPDVLEWEPPQGGGPQGVPRVSWSWLEAVAVYLLGNILLGQLLVVVALVAIYGSDVVENALSGIAVVLSGTAADLVFLAFMVLWLNGRHRGWRAALGLPPTRGGLGREIRWGAVAGLILYPAIAFGVGVVLQAIFDALFAGDVTAPEQLPSDLSTLGWALAAVLAIGVAPIVEELFFRGVLFRSLRDRYGFWVGALASSVLFGAAHYVSAPIQDAVLLQSVMIFTGLGLAWIYERRGTLVANVAAHMAFNTIGIALIFAVR